MHYEMVDNMTNEVEERHGGQSEEKRHPEQAALSLLIDNAVELSKNCFSLNHKEAFWDILFWQLL